MSSHDDRLLRAAAEAALAQQPQLQQRPQQPQSQLGFEHIIALGQVKALSPRQVFEYIFEGKRPEKYEGE
jgi:hypothetical protein